jgi:hypothetical protein
LVDNASLWADFRYAVKAAQHRDHKVLEFLAPALAKIAEEGGNLFSHHYATVGFYDGSNGLPATIF